MVINSSLIIQWGRLADKSNKSIVHTLAIAFPNQPFIVHVSGHRNDENTTPTGVGVASYNRTKTTFQTEAFRGDTGNVAMYSGRYIAIGC